MKLSKPLVIKRFGGEKRTIEEIVIKKEQITAGIIIKAEQALLANGGFFPSGDMESSKSFQAYILAELLDMRYDEVLEMEGQDFLELSNILQGFLGNSVLKQFQAAILGKQL